MTSSMPARVFRECAIQRTNKVAASDAVLFIFQLPTMRSVCTVFLLCAG